MRFFVRTPHGWYGRWHNGDADTDLPLDRAACLPLDLAQDIAALIPGAVVLPERPIIQP